MPDWYIRWGKRSFDCFASILGLILLSPFLLCIALSIRLTSRGPALFGHLRVGRDGRLFRTWKFRSMIEGAERVGPGVTASGDPRITPIGRFLRNWKLDELPQLWNVLCGDMSLVGPRPEVPSFVAHYSSEQRKVLSVRPGITDPASIMYRNEEELIASAGNQENYYEKVILPAKLQLSLAYVNQLCLKRDLRLILQTLSVLRVVRNSANYSNHKLRLSKD
jgi:lipopolysaccharide/colanic/teichoic acid biosynthesis glycosyltransferase